MRRIINFNDNWTFNMPGEAAVNVTLPHTWNAQDGQDGGNDYWRGTATYSRSFARPELKDGERCYIEFGGAAMTADHRPPRTDFTALSLIIRSSCRSE